MKTKQEREQRRNAFREMAAQLSGELAEGKHIQRLEKARQEVQGIERYSPLNQLLILTQCPNVTEVHGYMEWQSLGYQVCKGETAIAIRAPHTRSDEDGPSLGFHLAYVFDRSQVDPIAKEQGQEEEHDEKA